MPNTIDYDEYARKRPGFHCSDRHPDLYTRALAEQSGTYADIGCGDGTKLAHSVKRGDLSNFKKLMAFDVSAERIKKVTELIPGIEGYIADAQSLPCDDMSIDLYFSDQVIEHVPNDRLMAEEIYRVLKPGGRALVGSTIKGPGAWYFYRCNGEWVIDPTHLREYRSMEEYTSVFSGAGLRVVETELLPTIYSMGDLALRVLALARTYKNRTAPSAAISWLANRHIRIPRYWLCYALVSRPD
jgi:SAM-dependent methyltransferase